MELNHIKRVALAAAVAMTSSLACAQEISGTDILNLLVEQGVLTPEAADKLIEKVRKRNKKAQAIQEEKVKPGDDSIRVPFVPGYVKEELKHGVAAEVRGQVLEDLVAQARTERWNVPGAQPRWTDKIKITGDARLRYDATLYDSGNIPFQVGNYQAINDAKSINSLGRYALVNVTDDTYQMKGRFRLMLTAKPTEGIELGMRLTTGNDNNPVSSNQTLGGYEDKWNTSFDLAYIKYTDIPKSVMLEGGKIKNPFLHTDLVWDSDLNFEGVAGTWNMLRSEDLDEDDRQWDPFITLGAFPLDYMNIPRAPEDTRKPPKDKWLYAAQIGTHYQWWDQSKLSLGLAYYDYENISGVQNELNSNLQDGSAPAFIQWGNWTYNISTTQDGNTVLYGLASKYRLADLTMQYDYAGFSPHHVIVTADVVKNIAFDRKSAAKKADQSYAPNRDLGYQLGVTVGWPNLDLRGNWDFSFTYRHLEGDAVLDAFADSDFLLGGTNAKGYILQGRYAIMDSVYTSLRWVSAEEMDADPLISVAVDRLFLDVGTKF